MMRLRVAMLGTMLGLGAVGLGPVLAQESPPVPPQPQQDATPAVGQWIHDLGSGGFRTRLQAENELRKLGQKALPELRKAAEQTDDHEVQWRARRLVRQIERGGAPGLVQRTPSDRARSPAQPGQTGQGWPADDVQQRFEQLFRDMEDQLGLDIPRSHFFEDDFFRDLQQQMQHGGGSQSHGMSMQIGPDGAVRVEVQETDADGKAENKVYEAPDMDTFQQQYPGVLQRNGLGFGVRLWSGDEPQQNRFFQLRRGASGDPFGKQLAPGARSAEPPVDADADQQVRSGQRLGVAVHPEIPAELREHLGLADGVGLMVQSVAPDSLASSLGLRAGDIVLRIHERSIGSPADVQSALASIDAGADVAVAFLRKGTEQVASAKKPAAKPDAVVPKDGNLRPRTGSQPAKVR